MDLIMRFARRILRSLGTGPRLCLRNGSPDGPDRDAEHPGTLGLALTASEQSPQVGDDRAVHQRRQADGEGDAAELPSVPVE
jgi:hypothetical protein